MTLNKMIVIGNVGTDPEMRYTPNGNAVTSFRIATNYRYTTSEGEQKEETEWFTVTAWNRLAEQCNQYVTKGMKVYAEGRLKSESWTGNDEQTRFRNEIVASQVRFLDRGASAPTEKSTDSDSQQTPAGSQQTPTGDAEDLPW
tara:strand:- start:418 stop:846 length:429 start_codon:yes stop_codon:yes gene_type:complete